MSQQDVLLRLVEDVYAAPGTDTGWEVFLRHVCHALHGSGANLVDHNLVDPGAQILLTVGLDPAAGEAYAANWGRYDPWAYSAGTRQLVSGQVVSGEQLISHETLKRTAFYHEFGLRFDVTRCLAAMVEHDRRRLSCLTIDRGENGTPFSAADAGLVATLLPHLRRSLELHRRLVTVAGQVAARSEALDRVPHGVLLLSTSGRVLFANRMAESLLRAGDGISCEHGELRASCAKDTAALHGAIAKAIAAPRTPERGARDVVLLGRSTQRRPLVAAVSPVPAGTPLLMASAPAAILFVTDPEGVRRVDERVLARAFGLTLGEAKLARRLAQGQDLRQAATVLGLTIGTVRTRLKAIFHKTDTHRQADLIPLLQSAAGDFE